MNTAKTNVEINIARYSALYAIVKKPAKKTTKNVWAPKGTRIPAGEFKGYKVGTNVRNKCGHVYELAMMTGGQVCFKPTWKNGEDPRKGSLRKGRASWPWGKLVNGKLVTVKRLVV